MAAILEEYFLFWTHEIFPPLDKNLMANLFIM